MFSLIIFTDSKDVALFTIITSAKSIQNKKAKFLKYI